MKYIPTIALAALLAGCGSNPVNPTLVQDGQLAVTILSTLVSAAAQQPGVPARDINDAQAGLAAMQNALTNLETGKTTPADFAKLATDDIALLAPMLENDLKANTSIRTGVAILTGLIPIITAEVVANQAPTPKASLNDPRAKAQVWVATHR